MWTSHRVIKAHQVQSQCHTAPHSPCEPALVHSILFEGVGALYECEAEDGERVREGGLLEGEHVELPVVHLGKQNGDLAKVRIAFDKVWKSENSKPAHS